MNKQKLYIFSVELRNLLENQCIPEAIDKINQKNFSQSELDFLFMCLTSSGYDSDTDRFVLCESDNSAFLDLVNLVMSKVSTKE